MDEATASEKPIELSNKMKNTPKEVLKSRLMYGLLTMLGKKCKLTTILGKVYQGTLFTWDSNGAVLLDCKEADEAPVSKKFGTEEIMSVELKGISPIVQKRFKTDTEISKAHTYKTRELQQFVCEGEIETMDETPNKAWNQFDYNEKTFGVKSTYHEKYYTTELVKEHELTADQIRRAQRIEKELEGSKGDERLEDDEEAAFGAVLNSGRYKKQKKSGKDLYKQVRNELVQPRLEKNSGIKESAGLVNLIPGTPEMSEEVKREFKEFKKEKEKVITREEMNEKLKSFSKDINETIGTMLRVRDI